MPDFVQGKGGDHHTTDPRYIAWITQYVRAIDEDERYVGDWTLASKLKGMCGSACSDMLEVFPELRCVRGTVVSKAWVAKHPTENLQEMICPDDGHIWLETEAGEIVDPTAAQLGNREDALYVAFDESQAHTLPTGKCPNCGDYCYNGTDCCTEECFYAYAAYLGLEVSKK